MKVLYIVLAVLISSVIIVLGLSFFYLDQQRRQAFLYAIYYDDEPNGYESMDRFILENSMVYKSMSESPRDILRRKSVCKITLDSRGKDLVSYVRETKINGAEYTEYLSSSPQGASFLASGFAEFFYIEELPRYGNDMIFLKTCVATYPSIIRRYNFKKRGQQFINALLPTADFLPPLRSIIALTSRGRDAVEIDGEKIYCERIEMKFEDGRTASVWVTKPFHHILMIEAPEDRFKAVLSSARGDIPVQEYRKKSDLYVEKDVAFKNEDIELRGTLTVPTAGTAPYPSVILVADTGPLDRDAMGIFSDIAHYLSEAGYCVLRFDKRGIGQSGGTASTYAQSEIISDLQHALGFVKTQAEIDNSRIGIISQSGAGFYGIHLASTTQDIKTCILISAPFYASPLKNNRAKLTAILQKIAPNDDVYVNSVIAAVESNKKIIDETGDWTNLLGKRVFAKKAGLEDEYAPLEAIKKLDIPVLILRDKALDQDIFLSDAKENFTTIYFSGAEDNFAKFIKNTNIREHFEIEQDVIKSIISWLDKYLKPLQTGPEEPAAG